MQRCLLFGEALPSDLSEATQYSLVKTRDENGRETEEDGIKSQLTVLIRELASSILRSFDAKVWDERVKDIPGDSYLTDGLAQ